MPRRFEKFSQALRQSIFFLENSMKKELNHNNFDTSFVKIDQVLVILWRLKGEKYPIPLLLHIEVIDHIDWLRNELAISTARDQRTTYLLMLIFLQ